MAEEENYDYIIWKIVLLGQSNVGKTSIISRYVNNKFSDFIMSTTGATFASKNKYWLWA